MNLHNRQFIIGPKKYLPKDKWKTQKLIDSLYLYHCENLPVYFIKDLDSKQWCIIGDAIQTESDRPNPINEISINHTNKIELLSSSWGGRWILIGNNKVNMDATGNLGCFYQIISAGPNKGLWISSSPALLNIIESNNVIDSTI